MKILIINTGIHEKNKQGLVKMLEYLHRSNTNNTNNSNIQEIEYKIGTGTIADIQNYDIIYNPSKEINTSLYPNKKFIFGPHFSTFPNNHQLQSLQNNKYKNSIYIQPSEWVVQLWKNMGAEQFLPIKSFPFPVNTEKFTHAPDPAHAPATIKNNVLVYYKHRSPQEFNQLKDFLIKQNINFRLFDYRQRYNETDYLAYLQTCKYGILLDAHESQGFAVEEALSCNVPLLVWNTQTMNQEHGSSYHPIPCTSIPYWDNSKCGEYFHHISELPYAFQTFQNKLNNNQYNPRQYILDNLSTEKCAERFVTMINSI